MTPVLTRSYTNARDCANLSEKTLTVADVKARGLRQYFSLPMEGDRVGADCQPLIVPSVPMSDGVAHDILIICSNNNTIWCYDANDSADLWMKKIGYPVNGSKAIDMWAVNDHFGVLSTPVIDPDTYKLYVVPWISPDGTPQNGEHHVVEIDIRTGNILKSTGLNSLTYNPGNGLPVQSWKSSTMRKQRSSLLLTNVNGVKTVFFASGAVMETAKGASGWVVAYDCASGKVSATFALTSHWYGGGVWMAGQGLAADSAGYIYGISGNGSFDGKTDFAECCFKLQYAPPGATAGGSLKIVDWWSPYSDAGRVGQNPTWPTINYQTGNALPKKVSGVSLPSEEAQEGKPVNAMPEMPMEHSHGLISRPNATGSMAWSDEDLGSSGVAIIEQYGVALFSGKDGVGYSADMHNLGKTQLSDFANPAENYKKLKAAPVWFTFYPGAGVSPTPQNSADLDFMYANRTHHMHSTAAVYDGPNGVMVFCAGENGNVRAWSLDATGKLAYLACSREYASPNAPVPSGGMPGMMLALSANGKNPGTALLWACCPLGDANKTVTQGVLYCYDAGNFGKYADGSGALTLLYQSPTFTYCKFCPPVISGGRVFVNTFSDQVLCFGLA